MKLQTTLENLTVEQERAKSIIEGCLNETMLAEIVLNEDRAWEQWQENHEEYYSTERYYGGYNTPPGAVFEETVGPEDWLDEDDRWTTQEGEDCINAAEGCIQFIQKHADEILKDALDKDRLWFYKATDSIDTDPCFDNVEDLDKAYEILERVLLNSY